MNLKQSKGRCLGKEVFRDKEDALVSDLLIVQAEVQQAVKQVRPEDKDSDTFKP